ncbi:MAG: alpha/beta hydrolase-fold protein [Oscillospiraceae bacterium]|nr:alpha/beta hydrolase-fold protein [Oscillospiraceae bacterium]
MLELEFARCRVDVFLPEGAARQIVYLHAEREEAKAVWQSLTGPRPILAAISRIDWNRDLSPWPAEKAFRGGEDFAGEAGAHLARLTGQIIPHVERELPAQPVFRGLAGYSLAGLFAVWALYQTDVFDGAASMSGSLWFDGFSQYARERSICRVPRRLYLSLGDREKNTKSQRMAAVERCTLEVARSLEEKGAAPFFENRPGGHFQDVTERIVRGVNYLTVESGG